MGADLFRALHVALVRVANGDAQFQEVACVDILAKWPEFTASHTNRVTVGKHCPSLTGNSGHILAVCASAGATRAIQLGHPAAYGALHQRPAFPVSTLKRSSERSHPVFELHSWSEFR